MTAAMRLPPAYRLVALGEVDSAIDEARLRADAGADEGTLIWVSSQRKGRGRHGRHWHSPPGNLYMALILRPECPPREAGQLAFVAALGVGGAIGALMPPMSEIAFKWPNDILLNERKVAGILIETSISTPGRLDWMVLGIGVNVAQAPEGDAATSLRFDEGGPITIEETLEAFCRHFLVWVNRWRDDGFAPIRAAWLHHAQGIGAPATVRLANETVVGTFVDLDPDGALIVETANGYRRAITAGDVFFGDGG